MPRELDKFDRQILDLIQRDSAVATERLADQVHLSVSAVQRRIKRMRQSGTIQREVAVVDARRIGRPLKFIATLEIEREHKELLQQLQRWISAEDSIQQAFYVTGDVEIILIVTACDMDEYDQITQKLLEDNKNVRRMTTHVTLQEYKNTLYVPTYGRIY